LLRIDVRGLADRGARIYRDLDSASGINIDRLDNIAPDRIVKL
jgi:hypothetical protein